MTLSVISLLEDIRPSESIPGGFPRPLQGNKVCRYVSPEIGPIAFARLLWEPSSLPPPLQAYFFLRFPFSLALFFLSFFLSFSPLVSSRLFYPRSLVPCLSRFGHRSFTERTLTEQATRTDLFGSFESPCLLCIRCRLRWRYRLL